MMKNKFLIISLEAIVLLLVLIWFLLFAIAMSCPSCTCQSCTEPNYIDPSEIIILIAVSLYSLCILLINKEISNNNNKLIIFLTVLFGLLFILGTIPQQYWLSKNYFNVLFEKYNHIISYPFYGMTIVILAVVLLFSDLKHKLLSILLIIIPKIIIGFLLIIFRGDLYLIMLLMALIDIIFVVKYSNKYKVN